MLFPINPYLILNNQGQILPSFQLTQNQHILGRDSQVADFLVPPDWEVISRCQATLLKVEDNYYIYDGDHLQPSSNKLFINNHLITHDRGYCLQDGDVIKIGQNFNVLITLEFHDPNHSSRLKIPFVKSISLKNKSVILGRDPSANLQLLAPTVSRQHTVIEDIGQGKYILHDRSTNGVFVNNTKVNGKIDLDDGAIIRIAPYTLVLQGDELVIADQGNYIRLDAENILKIVKNVKGEKIVLLNKISLPIEPGQLVALVGGSGAGKSTFMRTLLGIESTTVGQVYLNGEDLRSNFNIYRNQIGYVPQTDIVHKELTVREVLKYAAKLRLPADTDINLIIEQTLTQIEMAERSDTLVKNLSGGQLKRVSIGVELLVNPKLFFLDEPTSGLDPGLDKKMMLLLKKLSNQGRTIILVTHATSNIHLCDRLVFLGQGGNLCYFGNFEDACDFFGITGSDFADIYIQLDNKESVLRTADKFKKSPYYNQYIDQKLGINKPRISKTEPEKVQGFFRKQVSILAQRYCQLLLRDRVSLIISLITAPVGIFLINLAIINKEPFILGSEPDSALAPLAQTVLFVFTCAAIWVGLSSSLQELVKENNIYLRERLVNLSLIAYLSSKVFILAGLALLQTLLMVIAILWSFSSPDSLNISWFWGVSITSFLTLFTSMCLGLMISAAAKNSSQANSALPILLLPQIIFSEVLFKMEGIGKCISWLMISRWSIGAYGSLVNINNLVPNAKILPDGTAIESPFKITSFYESSWNNLSLYWGILITQALFYWLVTLLIQKKKDII